ncbi:MAG: histidine kinase, partial [bacterium]|nr:histidine kinase [bacterium]
MKHLKHFSLAKQLRYGVLLIVGLCVLGTGSVLILLSFREQMRTLRIAQRERSRAAAEEIDAYIDDLQRKLSYLARVQGFLELPPDILQTFLEALPRHNTAYESVAVTDNRGRLLSAVAPYGHSLENDLTDSLAFRRAYQEREDFFSPVEFDPAIQVPLVTMAVPIRDMQDEIAGALIAKVNLGFLWFVVSKTEVGDSGYAYLVDDRRFLVVQKGDLP